jgi:hypothetical protein
MSSFHCEIETPGSRRARCLSLCLSSPTPDDPRHMTRPFRLPPPASPSPRCGATVCCSSLVHQRTMREDGHCPVWIVLSVSQKRVRRNSYMVSIPPFSLGTASGEFLRPATSALLLFRFLPKTFRKQQRRLFVPLPKCRPSSWEQTPLAFKCPNYKGKRRLNKCTRIASN